MVDIVHQSEIPRPKIRTSKEEYLIIINWINSRWVNNPIYTRENLKKYYDDFKHFTPDTNWDAINGLYDEGRKFAPTPSEWKARANRLAEGTGGGGAVQYEAMLESGSNREGLNEYLSRMNYDSFWHAVYETGHKRYKANALEKHEDPETYKRPWSEAKDDYLASKKNSRLAKILSNAVGEEIK